MRRIIARTQPWAEIILHSSTFIRTLRVSGTSDRCAGNRDPNLAQPKPCGVIPRNSAPLLSQGRTWLHPPGLGGRSYTPRCKEPSDHPGLQTRPAAPIGAPALFAPPGIIRRRLSTKPEHRPDEARGAFQ